MKQTPELPVRLSGLCESVLPPGQNAGLSPSSGVQEVVIQLILGTQMACRSWLDWKKTLPVCKPTVRNGVQTRLIGGGAGMSPETEESKRAWSVGGVCVPGGLLLGMGIGWALGHLVPGLLAGLGVGFLGMAVVVALMRPRAG